LSEPTEGDPHDLGFPYSIEVVGFSAEDRSGEPIDLTTDPDEPVFVRTRDGDKWPADSFVGYFLVSTEKNIHDFGPATLASGDAHPVIFPVTLPPGSFHVETDQGQVEVAKVTVRVEFRLRSD
jgi:hypothetical protein